jgi:hypothetical protein
MTSKNSICLSTLLRCQLPMPFGVWLVTTYGAELCDTDALRDQLLNTARSCSEAALALFHASMRRSVAGHVGLALRRRSGSRNPLKY